MKRAMMLGMVLLSAVLVGAQAPPPLVVGQAKPGQTEVTPKFGLTVGSTYNALDVAAADLAYEKEKNLNLQSQLLQTQYQQQIASMQQQYAALEKAKQDVIDKIKKTNNFGDDTTYDPEQGKWFKTEKAKAPEKPAAPVKEPVHPTAK